MLMESSLLLKCKGYLFTPLEQLHRSENTPEYCPLNKNFLERRSVLSLYGPGQGSFFWRFAEHLTISVAP